MKCVTPVRAHARELLRFSHCVQLPTPTKFLKPRIHFEANFGFVDTRSGGILRVSPLLLLWRWRRFNPGKSGASAHCVPPCCHNLPGRILFQDPASPSSQSCWDSTSASRTVPGRCGVQERNFGRLLQMDELHPTLRSTLPDPEDHLPGFPLHTTSVRLVQSGVLNHSDKISGAIDTPRSTLDANCRCACFGQVCGVH